jgi:hypothetical protein
MTLVAASCALSAQLPPTSAASAAGDDRSHRSVIDAVTRQGIPNAHVSTLNVIDASTRVQRISV